LRLLIIGPAKPHSGHAGLRVGQFLAVTFWTRTILTGILCALIKLVISGGQIGADQAGWRAAHACDIPTGGWMPKGFLTEEGPQPSFADLYGAREMPTASNPARSEQNVRDSDGTVWFGTTDSPGAKTTLHARKEMGKPLMLVISNGGILPSDVVTWIETQPQKSRLNIAGNRESKSPGIGERVERFLTVVLKRAKARADP
jgi:Circularly permutated YpsA SLOG family